MALRSMVCRLKRETEQGGGKKAKALPAQITPPVHSTHNMLISSASPPRTCTHNMPISLRVLPGILVAMARCTDATEAV